eukprot:4730512-Pyramimonas_sp.AAC.1
MWFPPYRRAHSFIRLARASRVEGDGFSQCCSPLNGAHIRFQKFARISKCGSRLSAAHTRLYNLQGFHGFS